MEKEREQLIQKILTELERAAAAVPDRLYEEIEWQTYQERPTIVHAFVHIVTADRKSLTYTCSGYRGAFQPPDLDEPLKGSLSEKSFKARCRAVAEIAKKNQAAPSKKPSAGFWNNDGEFVLKHASHSDKYTSDTSYGKHRLLRIYEGGKVIEVPDVAVKPDYTEK